MKHNLIKLFCIVVLLVNISDTLFAADNGINQQLNCFSTNRTIFNKVDTFVTKKADPKKEEKKENVDTDVYAKLSSESNESLIAAAIGLGTIFFLPIIGFIGNMISIKKNKKIKLAIKDKSNVPDSLKSNLQISNILNVLAGIIHGLYALFIIFYIIVIILIIVAFGI